MFHLASPFPSPEEHQSDKVLTPVAVEGTLSVLRACVGAGTVKRVVLTSSIAAISSGRFGNPGKPADYLYSESDWSDETLCTPYERSKLRAEWVAWEFMQKVKTFDLVVLNPGYVQGPLLSLAAGDASKRLCAAILSNQVPGIPNIAFPLVDVRDVAAAHIAALENPRAGGNRYVLVSKTVNMREVAMIIAEEFNLQGYRTPTIPVHKALVYVARFFDTAAHDIYPYVDKAVRFNNEKMRNELGITPYSVKNTIIDTCYSLVDLGAVKRTRGYLGHPSTRSALHATSSFPPPTTSGQIGICCHRLGLCAHKQRGQAGSKTRQPVQSERVKSHSWCPLSRSPPDVTKPTGGGGGGICCHRLGVCSHKWSCPQMRGGQEAIKTKVDRHVQCGGDSKNRRCNSACACLANLLKCMRPC